MAMISAVLVRYYSYETIVDYLNWLFNAGIAISLEAIIYYMSGYTVNTVTSVNDRHLPALHRVAHTLHWIL